MKCREFFFKCNWFIMLLCLFTYCSQPLRWQALTLWWRHQCSLQRSRLEKSLFGVFIQLKIGNALYAQKLFGYVLYGFSGIELVYFEHICFLSIQGCFNFVWPSLWRHHLISSQKRTKMISKPARAVSLQKCVGETTVESG